MGGGGENMVSFTTTNLNITKLQYSTKLKANNKLFGGKLTTLHPSNIRRASVLVWFLLLC